MTSIDDRHDTDEAIIGRIRRGDVRAFALLVDRHKERGMALASRMMRDRQDAEEALQDAFVRAFKALPSFEMRSSFATWFYRIIYNVCASRLARRRDHHELHDPMDSAFEDRDVSEDPLPDAALESGETTAIIREEIGKLPEIFGTALMLFAVHERSYDEIVEITGAPLGTVKARIFRARAMLRDAIAARLGRESGMGQEKKEQAA